MSDFYVYLYLNNQVAGPYTVQVLYSMYVAGTINHQTQCCFNNGAWMPLSASPFWVQIAGTQFSNPAPQAFVQEQQGAPSLSTNNESSSAHSIEAVEEDKETQEIAEIASLDLSMEEPDEDDGTPLVTCPHCWHQFRMSKIHYISRHLELMGDPVLGPAAQTRFLPTRFTASGDALDARGLVCHDMACPRCHLMIPMAILDDDSQIVSIVGSPAAGKSYFLTSLVHQMQLTLPEKFQVAFADTDVAMNHVLNSYQDLLFANLGTDKIVSLPKTELQGSEFSSAVTLSGFTVNLPLPFMFSLSHYDDPGARAKNLIMYDNAGEHFEPGRDDVTNLATQHLAKSSSIFFLFDPFKDKRTLTSCTSKDPQASIALRNINQNQILQEMTLRIRKYSNLHGNEKIKKPLIVVVPKFDAWRDTFPLDLEDFGFSFFSQSDNQELLDLSVITFVSFAMRQWLLKRAPEIVHNSEAAFDKVYFVPVSALGCCPQYDETTKSIGVKSETLKPLWSEVPMLIHLWNEKIIAGGMRELYPGCRQVEVSLQGNRIMYANPVTGKRDVIPALYCGAEVYDSDAQEVIRIPVVDQPETPVENASDNSVDNFWTK